MSNEAEELTCSKCGKTGEEVMAINIRNDGKKGRAICYDCWNAA